MKKFLKMFFNALENELVEDSLTPWKLNIVNQICINTL